MSTTYAQLGKSATISCESILDNVGVLNKTENKLLCDLAIDIMRVLEYDKEFKVVLERHVDENPFRQEETIHVYAKVLQTRHGHWIESKIPCERYVCSECGGAAWYYDYKGDVAKSRYCPNCGAKMDGGEDDDKTD